MTPKVYILIVNYNGWEDIIECLESVLRLDYADFQVVVVDNNSSNNSVAYIKKWAAGEICMWNGSDNPLQHIFAKPLPKPLAYNYYEYKQALPDAIAINSAKLTIIQAGTNGGFASGNNIFIRSVLQQDAYIWLLNPDMVVENDTLRNLVNCNSKHSTEVVFGSVIKDYLQPEHLLIYGGAKMNHFTGTITFTKNQEQEKVMDYIHGGSLFTHLRNFKTVGLLPEEYFLYGEETDWCYQARQQGVKLSVCSHAICYDKVSTSIGKGYMAEYYYTLNSLKFHKKYKKKYIPFILISNGLRICKRFFKLETDKIRAIVHASWHFTTSSKH
jgi:GT2 family glycosyltransferase